MRSKKFGLCPVSLSTFLSPIVYALSPLISILSSFAKFLCYLAGCFQMERIVRNQEVHSTKDFFMKPAAQLPPEQEGLLSCGDSYAN